MKITRTVLLTGIAGSIGCHTLAHIMEQTDWHVVGIASFTHKGIPDRITEICKVHPEWWQRLTIITHDLTAPFSSLTKKKIGPIDYIINLAALSDVEASIQNPGVTIMNNTALMINILEYAREQKPEVFLHVSTDEVYGPSGRDYGHPEWSPIIPSNPYSASKACQEAIGISYWRTYGVPLIITNTMNNFGEMQQGSKYPAMIQKWVAKGEPVIIHGKEGDIGTRHYIHSRNHADALLFILGNLPPYIHHAGEIDRPDRYNIVGDIQLDNLELAEMIASFMGKPLKRKLIFNFHETRPGHDKHYGLDPEKLRKLGWRPPLTFEESMRRTIAWQAANPHWLE